MKNLILFTAFLLTLISCESDDSSLKKDLLIQETIKNLDLNTIENWKYEYNSNNLISGHQYFKNSQLMYNYIYRYNSNNQLIELERDMTEPNEVSKTKYYYNSDGYVIKEEDYRNNGELSAIYDWDYSNLNLVKLTQKNTQNQLILTTYYTILNNNIQNIKYDYADPSINDSQYDFQSFDSKTFRKSKMPLLNHLSNEKLNTNNPLIAIRKNALNGDIYENYKYDYQFDEKNNYKTVNVYNQLNDQLKYVCEYEWKNN
ncbi:hypothetical protein FLAVO9AF_100005 [Flavobacterium sp. 9AF]|uniref:hypothetical protein n=1 Tax=Flavobacterium sp. 9AF TaxID=2653142 RepID=UPI0012F0CFBE|nr:hypothetical protein [Flavobacterium sp. 9AF]VXB01353.1 hypothetical protein FLAVO9AF_100005 [Flavobacterium sp. 9AF]